MKNSSIRLTSACGCAPPPLRPCSPASTPVAAPARQLAAAAVVTQVLGYVFGDGTIYFNGGSGQGITTFYGDAIDLEQIRADVTAVGFSPNNILTRSRQHRITTRYNDYE